MELPYIGQNCMVCNRDDYLPFQCSHCTKIVCIDHKTDHGAECPLTRTHFEADPEKRVVADSLKKTCDFCKKITLKLELVECSLCHKFNCLYHRHQVQHKCNKLAQSEEAVRLETEQKLDRQRAALEKLKEITPVTSTPPKPQTIQLDPKKKALAKRIKLMRIKQSARGPPNTLVEDRIYFEVKFVHEPKSSLSVAANDGKTLKIFTTRRHTIGRLIDLCAEELGVVNKNHIDGASQLCFKRLLESGELVLLNSQSNFDKLLLNGELEEADEIVLTYQEA